MQMPCPFCRDTGSRTVTPNDFRHLIEFRDDGWTIQHTLTERVDGALFDCPLGNWTGGDPGVRGRFILNDDGTRGDSMEVLV